MMHGAILAIGFVTLAMPAAAQTLQTRLVNIYDPILKPGGNHIAAREYKVWNQAPQCPFGVLPELIMALHGAGGTPAAFSQSFKPQPGDCTVVVYPAGSDWAGDGRNYITTGGSWNASGRPSNPGAGPNCPPGQGRTECQGVADDAFLSLVRDTTENEFGPFRATHGLGMSKGGMMMHGLACRDAVHFDAIATVAATVNSVPCAPAYWPELMHMHGLADTLVCWSVWRPSCDPFPLAQEPVADWQTASAGGDLLVLITGCPHIWPTMSNCGYSAKLQIRNWFLTAP